jgi:hypothetical protein
MFQNVHVFYVQSWVPIQLETIQFAHVTYTITPKVQQEELPHERACIRQVIQSRS